MLKPDSLRVLRCKACGLPVDTRVARYVFVLIADRGRGGSTMKPDNRTVLCGPCGDRVREGLELFGVLEDLCVDRRPAAETTSAAR